MADWAVLLNGSKQKYFEIKSWRDMETITENSIVIHNFYSMHSYVQWNLNVIMPKIRMSSFHRISICIEDDSLLLT